jgi:hypothetical protein
MATYVMRKGRLVEKHLAEPLNVPFGRAASVISDVMAPVKHMGTGQVVDSKALFRAHTRASGCVEVGTDPAAARPGRGYEPPSMANVVQRAIAQLETR